MWIVISFFAAAGSLGTLYALHRQRSQAQARVVATMLFWQSANAGGSEPSAARGRFAQPWTFALLSAIALLLSGAMLLLSRRSDGRTHRVIVLDTGGAMRWRGDAVTPLDRTIDEIERNLDPADVPAVVTAGEETTLLVAAGEPISVARSRLDSLRRSTAAIGSCSAQSFALAGQLIDEGPAADRIDWYTADSSLPDGLASSVAGRIRLHPQAPVGGYAAITGLQFDSSDTSAGALRVRLTRSSTAFSRPLQVIIDGSPTAQAADFAPSAMTADITIPNLLADGSQRYLELRDRSNHLLQTSLVRVPRRLAWTVAVDPTLPAAIRAAAASPGTGGDGPVLAVGWQGSAVPAGAVASIQIVRDGARIAAAPITAEPGAPFAADLDFEKAMISSGPAVAGAPLLRAGGSVVAGIDETSHTVYLSSGLVDASAELPRQAAFPVLMTRLLRHLAGWTDSPPVTSATRILNDPLWPSIDSRVPPTVVAVVEPATPSVSTPSRSTHQTNLASWALCLGLLLFTAEGLLLALRKIN